MRRRATKANVLAGVPLFWPSEPSRCPPERRHRAGLPVEEYSAWEGYGGTLSVIEERTGFGWDWAAFDVEVEP